MKKQLKIKLLPVVATTIKRMGYDTSTQTMAIEFKSDTLYHYYNVPKQVYLDMLNSESIGSFLAKEIKDKYKFEKVEL